MKERPILFSGPMVRAILDNHKTQTRRIIKLRPHLVDTGSMRQIMSTKLRPNFGNAPWGEGDILWVRESVRLVSQGPEQTRGVKYKADGDAGDVHFYEAPWEKEYGLSSLRWSPSIHMPRFVCRLMMKVEKVWPERLQDISAHDAMAEGVTQRGKNLFCMDWSRVGTERRGVKTDIGTPAVFTEKNIANDNPRGAFFTYFEKINGPTIIEENPWVWAIKFSRIYPDNGLPF